MKELSNNQLFIAAVIPIIISLFSIALSFGDKLSISGLAATDVGYVNVTVISTASITVWIKSVNFTGAIPGESRNSYNSTEVDTTGYLGSALPCDVDDHCGINITNDGNSFINITIYESERLFDSGAYNDATHFLYNVTMQDVLYTTAYGVNGNCSVGYDTGWLGIDNATWGQWRPVPAVAEVAICYLNYTNDGSGCTYTEPNHLGNTDVCPDIARVEFNITVPSDETPGDKAGTITFAAVAS